MKEKLVLKNSKIDDLLKQVKELTQSLAKLEVNRSTKPSKNVRERKLIRQKLAVIKTYIRQKELTHAR